MAEGYITQRQTSKGGAGAWVPSALSAFRGDASSDQRKRSLYEGGKAEAILGGEHGLRDFGSES